MVRSRSRIGRVAHAVLIAGSLLTTHAHAQSRAGAIAVGGGIGMIGVNGDGTVGQFAMSYDAPLTGRTRWWAGIHAGRDPNPGVASPGIRQGVTEVVVSLGPMVPIRGPAATTVFLGGGLYGVARRYGVAIESATAERVSRGTELLAGGDWGAVGRTALELGRPERMSVLLDAQWRYAYEGSVRRFQPAFSLGVRRTW